MNDSVDERVLTPGKTRRLGYQPALDGLRAVAALAVVGFHLRIAGFAGGSLGVDIFFVLSGFLITKILLSELTRTGSVSFRRFYWRRALRLLPAYFAVVVFSMILFVVVPVGGTSRGVIASFFYVANWVAASGRGGLGALAHTWSLSVEEQFYLLWPLLLVVTFRLVGCRVPALVKAVAGIWGAAWVITSVAVFLTGVSFDMLNNATHFRATELLAGCVLAVLVSRGHLQPVMNRPRLLSALGIIAFFGLVMLIAFGQATSNVTLIGTWLSVSVCTATLIASLQGPPTTVVGRILSLKPMVAIGIVSYGLYLWHFPVMVTVDALVGLDSLFGRIVSVAITGVLVVASYFLIERPFLRVKDRIRKRPRRSLIRVDT